LFTAAFLHSNSGQDYPQRDIPRKSTILECHSFLQWKCWTRASVVGDMAARYVYSAAATIHPCEISWRNSRRRVEADDEEDWVPYEEEQSKMRFLLLCNVCSGEY